MAALLSPKARLLSNFFYDTGLEKILHIICSLKIASTSNAICWQGTLAPRNPVGKGGKGSFADEGKIVTISHFPRNKCHKMVVTLSIVTHLGPGQNRHNNLLLQ